MAVVINGVIGIGIFRTPATIALHTGSSTEQLLAWAIGAAIALTGALCYAELGARRPTAGGGYVYLREAFGVIIAFGVLLDTLVVRSVIVPAIVWDAGPRVWWPGGPRR